MKEKINTILLSLGAWAACMFFLIVGLTFLIAPFVIPLDEFGGGIAAMLSIALGLAITAIMGSFIISVMLKD